jgi:hypothetical protein
MHDHIKTKPIPESRGDPVRTGVQVDFEEIAAISALLDRASAQKPVFQPRPAECLSKPVLPSEFDIWSAGGNGHCLVLSMISVRCLLTATMAFAGSASPASTTEKTSCLRLRQHRA